MDTDSKFKMAAAAILILDYRSVITSSLLHTCTWYLVCKLSLTSCMQLCRYI